MANYYVSNSGSSGAGTVGSPWGLPDLTTGASPNAPGVALTTLVAGDTLYFRGGTYHVSGINDTNYFSTQILSPTHSGTLSQPITLQPYPGEAVLFIMDNSTTQPLFGTASPPVDYVRFLGLTVTVSINGPAFYIAGTGHEVAYCELVGQNHATTDNHDVINLHGALDCWLHHNNIHDQTGDSINSSAIKIYDSGVLTIEDNYAHNCTSGMFLKDGGTSGAEFQNATFRRNLITGCGLASFTGPNQGNPSIMHVYDNVMDGCMFLGEYSQNSEFYNNLFRCSLTPVVSLSGSTIGISPQPEVALIADSGGLASSFKQNIWNNIVISSATNVWGFWNSNLAFGVGGSTDPLNYLDYNVYTVGPYYRFGGSGPPITEYTLAQIQVQGLETHAIVDTAANIFVNQTAYVLKGIYPTAGRFSDMVGPRYSIASILDTTRYGPAAIPGAGGSTALSGPPFRHFTTGPKQDVSSGSREPTSAPTQAIAQGWT